MPSLAVGLAIVGLLGLVAALMSCYELGRMIGQALTDWALRRRGW